VGFGAGIDTVEWRKTFLLLPEIELQTFKPVARLQWEKLLKLILDECNAKNEDTKFDWRI
jgi:hypothetical protein